MNNRSEEDAAFRAEIRLSEPTDAEQEQATWVANVTQMLGELHILNRQIHHLDSVRNEATSRYCDAVDTRTGLVRKIESLGIGIPEKAKK